MLWPVYKRRSLALVACAIGLGGIPGAAAAGQNAPLSVEDALSVLAFGQLMPIALSPDGEQIAFTVQDNRMLRAAASNRNACAGVPPWAHATDIWVLNLPTGEAKSLTGGKENNWQPVWSPDGRYLAFLSDQDGSGEVRLWVWDRRNRGLRKVFDAAVRGTEIEWTPNSRKLLVTTRPEDSLSQGCGRRESSALAEGTAGRNEAQGAAVALYESKPQNSGAPLKSDAWDLDVDLRDLSSVDLDSGKETVIVGGKRIAAYALSPDGSHVAYTIPKQFEKPGSQQILFDLAVSGIGGGTENVLASGIRLDYDGAAFRWSPDGRKLVFRTGGMDETVFDCYVTGLEGGTPRNVTQLPPPATPRRKASPPLWDQKDVIYFLHDGALWRASRDEENAMEVGRVPGRQIIRMIPQSVNMLWSPSDGQSTIVVTHDEWGKQDGFYRLDLRTGECTKLLEQGQCYTCMNSQNEFTVTRDGRRVVYFAEDARHDLDLWTSSSRFTSPLRLTHLDPESEKYTLGEARVIDWLSDDGKQIHGALLLPSGYQKGRRYPLLVWVYGGSSGSDDFDHFGFSGPGPFNMQLFATRGYAVLAPDAPLQLGTPMLDLAKTVLPGVNAVIEMGVADPDRLGVMGHSYGGYSTLGLIVETQRFKAAMDADGFADLFGAYGAMQKSGAAFGTSVAEEGQGLMGGTPWQFFARYVENSPVFHLDRVVTPLLIVHGADDQTVPPFLGDEVFVGLRRLGKEVQYAKYEGEDHSPLDWSYADQLDFCNRMIRWFDSHLKKPAK